LQFPLSFFLSPAICSWRVSTKAVSVVYRRSYKWPASKLRRVSVDMQAEASRGDANVYCRSRLR
jgi:hypothetical protein